MGANNSDSKNYNAVVGYTQTFGSNKFYELRAGYNRYRTHQFAEDFGIDKNNELGIPNGNLAALPGDLAASPASGRRGSATRARRARPTRSASARTYHLTDNLSWIRRPAHLQDGGGPARIVSGAVTNPQTQPQGRFTFDRNYTSSAGAAGTGYSFASFLLGYPNSVQRDIVDTCPQIRRNFAGLVRAGRLPHQPEAVAAARPALGPDDAARSGRQPPVELRPRPTG